MAVRDGEESTTVMDDYETLISTTDVELLKKAWRNEKGAPEILQFEDALVKRIQEQIQLMEENVEEFTQIGIDPLTVSLYHMDLDRTQFLLRSYLRIRLLKIENYMFHIIKTDYLWARLSEPEKAYAKRCTDAMDIHLQSSVLTKLPENYQSILKQSLISEEDDMVPKPHLNMFVVGKGKTYLPARIEPKGFQDTHTDDDRKPDDREFEVERGDLFFARYKVIMDEVIKGDIDLI
ncbi:Sld5 domain-containing protein [Cephalotus follicularis]|uniref:DNA replication complex GINS protein SLD5 n=1 Tax=Cephalotus follicularis TaxID=3775 RepID=A0A1Q3BUX5_CEPFO|nr:Sld5 domain-containing protein [Cephalotus follicularis]